MIWNENAGEPKPTGAETKLSHPDEEAGESIAPNIASEDLIANAVALYRPGGRFHVTSATMEVTVVGKLGRPVRCRVIRIVLESGCKPFEFSCQGGKLWVRCWAVTGFNLN